MFNNPGSHDLLPRSKTLVENTLNLCSRASTFQYMLKLQVLTTIHTLIP
jgi:hypothetical protein